MLRKVNNGNMKITYLTKRYIIELNKVAIRLFEQKKADRHEISSIIKLQDVLDNCEIKPGDHYDKAVTLICELVKKHCFASGNRRTALIASIIFLMLNNRKVYIKDDPYNSKIMLGIRENYYTDNEIKQWFRTGKIREFNRFA